MSAYRVKKVARARRIVADIKVNCDRYHEDGDYERFHVEQGRLWKPTYTDRTLHGLTLAAMRGDEDEILMWESGIRVRW